MNQGRVLFKWLKSVSKSVGGGGVILKFVCIIYNKEVQRITNQNSTVIIKDDTQTDQKTNNK